MVPKKVLSSKQPWALVAHDEVDALYLAVDKHVFLDQLAFYLVREVFATASVHLFILREFQGGGRGWVQQLLSLLSGQLIPLCQSFPVLLLIFLSNLEVQNIRYKVNVISLMATLLLCSARETRSCWLLS